MALLLVCVLSIIVMPANVSAARKRPMMGRPQFIRALVDEAGNGIYLEWKMGKNSDKTEIYVSINNGRARKIKTTEATEYYYGNINKNNVYKFGLRAVNGRTKGPYSDIKEAKVEKFDKNECFYQVLRKLRRKDFIDREKREKEGDDGQDDPTNIESRIARLSAKEVRFSYEEKDIDDRLTVTMDLSKSDVKKAKTDIDIEYEGVEGKFKATAKINMKKIKDGDDLEFKIKYSEYLSSYDATKRCKKMSKSAFNKWQETLLDDTDFMFDHLGFEKLSCFD